MVQKKGRLFGNKPDWKLSQKAEDKYRKKSPDSE